MIYMYNNLCHWDYRPGQPAAPKSCFHCWSPQTASTRPSSQVLEAIQGLRCHNVHATHGVS